jgi:hypothetical protein
VPYVSSRLNISNMASALAQSARKPSDALRPHYRVAAAGLRFPARGERRDPMTQTRRISGKAAVVSFASRSSPDAQRRGIFTMMSQEEFDKVRNDYEFVGFHGTTRWAVESIEANGIDTGLSGKYRGGISAAGPGLYTTDQPDVALHYARRAALGEPHAFDLDTQPQVIAVYRAVADTPQTAEVPPSIQGMREETEAFRTEHPAHEYKLGETPAPRKLAQQGIVGHTTLLSDTALSDPAVRYIGVALPVGQAAQGPSGS